MEIFKIMILFGSIGFLCFGMCVGCSIEAKNNEKLGGFFSFLAACGAFSLIIGIIGYLITLK